MLLWSGRLGLMFNDLAMVDAMDIADVQNEKGSLRGWVA